MCLGPEEAMSEGKRSPQSLDLGPGDKRLTVAALGPEPGASPNTRADRRNLTGWSTQPRPQSVTFNSDQREVPKSGSQN